MQNPGQEKFVDRSEKAVMEYVILSKAKEGEVTKQNLQDTFKGNLQPMSRHFDPCIQRLVAENRIRETGGKYTITDDGREDVQKLQGAFMEVPNVIGARGLQGGQRPGVEQPAGGRMSGGPGTERR